MIAAAKETWGGFLDILFPPKCLVCGSYGSVALCDSCRKGFAGIGAPFCDRCGVSTDGIEALCADCAAGSGWAFAQARAAGHFSGPLRKSILCLKYGGKRRLTVPLGAFLADYVQTNPFNSHAPDIIVPVPLHASRQRDRGFNQAALIAAEAGRLLDIPVAHNVLSRTRRTRPQVELHASERASNIRDAFRALESPLLRRKTVLLIDDVITTMNTVDECARVLIDAGAKEVYVVGVARGS